MTEPCVLAIDPGLTGGVAFFFPSAPERVCVEDMPVAAGEVDPAALIRRIRQMGPTIAVVERVGPRPHDGAVQAFNFGGAYAVAKTAVMVCEVPMHLVTPQAWKKHFNLRGGPEGKELARALALRLFPASSINFSLKKHHNRAEAALLAKFVSDRILKTTDLAA